MKEYIDMFSSFMKELIDEDNKKPQRLELRPAVIDEAFAKKWNVRLENGYCNLYVDGVKKSDTLYRLGGFGNLTDGKDYYIILKYLKESYSDSVTTDKKQKLHLASHECIIDKDGNEKIVNPKSFLKYVYLVGGVVYKYDDAYYNIETNEKICDGHKDIRSDEYIFVENPYDQDKDKRGVYVINKKTGDYKLYPITK
jgi:hypothetical protein